MTMFDPFAVQSMEQAELHQAQIDLARGLVNLEFLGKKQAFELAEGMNTQARQTQQQMFTQQMQVAVLQNNIAQFNSSQNLEVQQANISNQRNWRNDMSGLATQIGQLAQNPIDYARATATSLANSGWGEENNAFGGIDNTSPRSLMPLQQLLQIRAGSMGGPEAITPQPVGGQMPQPFDGSLQYQPVPVPLPNTTTLPLQPYSLPPNTTTLPPTTTTTRPPTTTAPKPAGYDYFPNVNGLQSQNWTPQSYSDSPTNPGLDSAMQTVITGGTPITTSSTGVQSGGQGAYWDPYGTGGVQYFNEGGQTQGGQPWVSGDAPGNDPSAGGARPELNIPLGDGRVAVLNEKQMAGMGLNLKNILRAADGGVFDMYAGSGDRGLATDFLQQNTQQALQGSGLGSIPAPVFASSPGFNPESAQYLAGLSQAAGKLSAPRYLQLAQLLQPAGVNEHAVRRSA